MTDDASEVKITISNPTVPEAKKLTMKDVWGKYDQENSRVVGGMVWARGLGDWKKEVRDGYLREDFQPNYPTKCPIWKEELPYKTVTVICQVEQEQEVIYWLDYVMGGGCVQKTKQLSGNRIAMQADYMC